MTHFGPVAPLTIHKQLAEADALGTYNLLIASEVLKAIGAYKRFWLDHPGFIIVDNGVIELDYPLPTTDLATAAIAVGASALILPDTIDDANMTRKQVRFAIREWKTGPASYIKTMGVVQGRTFAECIDCADSHVQAGVDYLAVPRGLTPNLGSRYDLVAALGEEHGKWMHLLGFSENIYDDIHSAMASPYVMGIDAATPVWLGMAGRKSILPYEPPRTANYGRRPEWFWQAGKQEGDSLAAIVLNTQRVRSWLASALAARKERLQSLGVSDPTDATNAPTARVVPLVRRVR